MAQEVKDTVVFDIRTETFTKFTALNIIEGFPLSYGSLEDNYLLILTDDGRVLRYPGDDLTSQSAELQTREVFMQDGILKYVRPYFEGDTCQILTRVKDVYTTSHWKEDLITNPESGKIIGIKNVKSRGESFSIEIQDADRVQKIGYTYQIKGEI